MSTDFSATAESDIGLALEMTNITKAFPGTIAVQNVTFRAYAGEVHAVIGENGAGKSTLMKILAGAFDDYEGQVSINGRAVQLHSPAVAREYGIGMVYQELSLAGPLSIAENVLVGRLPGRKGLFVDRTALIERARSNLARVGLDIDPRIAVEEISQHEAQLVEIAKVLGRNPCILVLDEPTSALSKEEIDRLFDTISRLRKNGLAIIYISHHLPEIFRIADRVTVLRDGRRIDTCQTSQTSTEQLVKMMVGKAVEELFRQRDHDPGEEALRIEGFTRFGFFHDIKLQVRSGEILGLYGLSGAGRTELARSIMGIDPVDRGSLRLEGRAVVPRSMRQMVDEGVAYLTEDRKLSGLALRLSVRDNVVASTIPSLCRNGWYDSSAARRITQSLIERLHIYPPRDSITVANLSGGNQQKTLLAKWLAVKPKILILDEPTRGVDINAKVLIHRTIEQMAQQGTAVILVSSDLPEVCSLADRCAVIRMGHVIGEVSGSGITEERLLMLANGEGIEKGAEE